MRKDKDSLGNRMKTFYEDRAKIYLPRRSDIIIRIDGCHFHSFTKGLEKPFDEIFLKSMKDTTMELCKNIQGCKFAYTQSDEISLWLTDYDTLETDAWFDNAVQKICSVSASMASMYFNRFFEQNIADNAHRLSDERVKKLLAAFSKGPYFDARCFTLPHQEVANYFIWRQMDAIRNSINSVGQSNFSQKELQGLNTEQVKRKLVENKCKYWEEYDKEFTYGVSIRKTDEGWVFDLDAPEFKTNRSYIEDLTPGLD